MFNFKNVIHWKKVNLVLIKLQAFSKSLITVKRPKKSPRDHGVSKASLYKWRQRYGGMEASELKRIKNVIGSGQWS